LPLADLIRVEGVTMADDSQYMVDFENRLKKLVKQTSGSRSVHIMNEVSGDGSAGNIEVDASGTESVTFCLNEAPNKGDILVHFGDKGRSFYLLYDVRNTGGNMWEGHIVKNMPREGLGHHLEPEELGPFNNSNFKEYDI
jgi:hypothetical protein